ncbi:hypothetical protein KQI74_12845 [Paenibacillus barcinonensis]|uniref:hypothetical protein n=1 Tax=Paenibacillus barcinonensis TaxID=198119 RepID=UPI001C117D81|nr:hypothetical protein [Paenibacillus barcinonensis]MBU5353179.1 hypothetical protein [Paenibacillus barcinonensis]
MSKQSSLESDIITKPYAERQLIVVLSDKEVKAQQKYKRDEDGDSAFTKVLKIAKTVSEHFYPSPLHIAEATIELYKGILKLREQGIEMLSVSQSEATKLIFPIGHPRFGVLYVAHPADASVYFPFAQFHRFTFEHKFSEAVTLLMSLGASHIEVQHVTGWSKEFSSKMDIAIPQVNVGAAMDASKMKKSGSEILFTANFEGNTSSSLPESLVWYHHEPTWKQIADGRLKYGMKDFSLTVRYEDDLGVNMGLKVSATKAKLGIGGTFEGHQSTIWKIIGEFA